MDADRAISASPAHHGRGAGPRAIVFEFNVPMLIDVLVELSRQYGWNPVYITSNYTKDLVKQYFPSIIYQETNDARFGQPAAEFHFGEVDGRFVLRGHCRVHRVMGRFPQAIAVRGVPRSSPSDQEEMPRRRDGCHLSESAIQKRRNVCSARRGN